MSRPQILHCSPIGIVRSPFRERGEAPHQPSSAREVAGSIELFPGQNFEHGLEDLSAWSHIWVLFWFHYNGSWRPKVLPPRSDRRRGVFATRAPHRPNPIGLSCVRLENADGLTLHVRGVDMLDGTPVLDIKPYVPHVDRVDDSNHGWLGDAHDPKPAHAVELSPSAAACLEYLRTQWGVDLMPRLRLALAGGPVPHPYRRIKRDGDGFVVALKDWRARFTAGEHTVYVLEINTGYGPGQLQDSADSELAVHRAFVRWRQTQPLDD